MKLDERDGKTIVLRPENAAEQEWLKRFEGAVVSLEQPRPFDPNVVILKLEAKE